jgi:predicted  nucleic acid-binding Zn-ribbon protein
MNTEKTDKKDMTIDDLALIVTRGFEKSEKLTDKKIEDLAILVQNGFSELKSELKLDIKVLENDIKEIKSDTEEIKAELNKKVDKFAHNDLTYRVEKLEEKFA